MMTTTDDDDDWCQMVAGARGARGVGGILILIGEMVIDCCQS